MHDEDKSNLNDVVQKYDYLQDEPKEEQLWVLIQDASSISPQSFGREDFLSYKEVLQEFSRDRDRADAIGFVIPPGHQPGDFGMDSMCDPSTGILYTETWRVIGHTEFDEDIGILVFRPKRSPSSDCFYEGEHGSLAEVNNEARYQESGEASISIDATTQSESYNLDESTSDHSNSTLQDNVGPSTDVTPEMVVATAAHQGSDLEKLWYGEGIGNGHNDELETRFVEELAKYCRSDPKLMDKCYRASERYVCLPCQMVPVWDTIKEDGKTYGEVLIEKAIEENQIWYGGDYIHSD